MKNDFETPLHTIRTLLKRLAYLEEAFDRTLTEEEILVAIHSAFKNGLDRGYKEILTMIVNNADISLAEAKLQEYLEELFNDPDLTDRDDSGSLPEQKEEDETICNESYGKKEELPAKDDEMTEWTITTSFDDSYKKAVDLLSKLLQ
jgi:hypothetical protein